MPPRSMKNTHKEMPLFEVLWLCLYLLVSGYKMAEKDTKRQEYAVLWDCY